MQALLTKHWSHLDDQSRQGPGGLREAVFNIHGNSNGPHSLAMSTV
jgi:hypothetical protein